MSFQEYMQALLDHAIMIPIFLVILAIIMHYKD